MTLGPLPTADGGSWTAELDGFNGRYELAYYLMTVTGPDGVAWGCFVEVDTSLGDQEERFLAALQPRADGKGRNTKYSGSMVKWLPARKAEAKERAAREAARALQGSQLLH